MNAPHAHTWTLINSVLRRYRCTGPSCKVVGYAPAGRRRQIVPYACQHELDGRKHCGKPATHVTHLRTAHRCAEHDPHNTTSSAAPAA